MELALYEPEFGYYARAEQRSGRAGDFFTSVDVGPIFGELLETQLEEMWRGLSRSPQDSLGASSARLQPSDPFDLVEAGAGNGRLAADILRAARRKHPALYDRIRLHLVESSPAARAAQREVLGDVADRLVSSGSVLPDSFEGVLIANEVIDAMPVHQVVMREPGLREVFVSIADGAQLVTTEDVPSAPALSAYLEAVHASLEPGWRAEINLAAVSWIREAARRLRRGFVLLIDYGHEARELYSASHSGGTLTAFASHTDVPRRAGPTPSWLDRPGDQDLTAHVDFTTLRATAEAAGLDTIAFLDQTYFLLGLLEDGDLSDRERRGIKTLVMPGGLGSTHKVLIFGKGVGRPPLQGSSFSARVT